MHKIYRKIKERKNECLNARTQLLNNSSTNSCQLEVSLSVLIEKLNALFSQEVRGFIKDGRYVYFKGYVEPLVIMLSVKCDDCMFRSILTLS